MLPATKILGYNILNPTHVQATNTTFILHWYSGQWRSEPWGLSADMITPMKPSLNFWTLARDIVNSEESDGDDVDWGALAEAGAVLATTVATAVGGPAAGAAVGAAAGAAAAAVEAISGDVMGQAYSDDPLAALVGQHTWTLWSPFQLSSGLPGVPGRALVIRRDSPFNDSTGQLSGIGTMGFVTNPDALYDLCGDGGQWLLWITPPSFLLRSLEFEARRAGG
jgi:hypothetical protein